MKAEQSMELKLPADMEYALIVRMALSGVGMLAELDVDLIDDMRTVTDECFDCLLHQGRRVREILVTSCVQDKRLHCRFSAVRTEELAKEPFQDCEVTRCILETLLPEVLLQCDEFGVSYIEFSMSV